MYASRPNPIILSQHNNDNNENNDNNKSNNSKLSNNKRWKIVKSKK